MKADVLLNPRAELIIGNIPGVNDVDEDMLEKWKVENSCDNVVTNAVIRQQTAKMLKESEKVTHSTHSGKQHPPSQTHADTVTHHQRQSQAQGNKGIQGTEVNDVTLTTLQKQDKTTSCWEKVGEPARSTKQSESKFVILKKMLHRVFKKCQSVTKQIVLPLEH